MIVNVAEAKANLSKLIALVCEGEQVTIAKNNKPLIDLVIHREKNQRKLGVAEGLMELPDNFMEIMTGEDEDINAMFYGDDNADENLTR